MKLVLCVNSKRINALFEPCNMDDLWPEQSVSVRRMAPLPVTVWQEGVSVYLGSLGTGVTGVCPGISWWPTKAVKVSALPPGGQQRPWRWVPRQLVANKRWVPRHLVANKRWVPRHLVANKWWVPRHLVAVFIEKEIMTTSFFLSIFFYIFIKQFNV
jgi:hypothetical protein